MNNKCYCAQCLKLYDFKGWDPKKFDWDEKNNVDVNYLLKKCKKYKHIWWKDYVIWKLSK